MAIRVQCGACQHRFQVKDEVAGRKVRCPECREPVAVPAAPSDGDEPEELDELPEVVAKPGKTGRGKAAARKGSPWYIRQWHWFVVAAVLLLALWPRAGVYFAGMAMLAGVLMALIGGVVPILQVVFGAPGTVLELIVSRSARFEMMNQPDSHPYKVLVRNAGKGTRGLLWRGVLLIVTFIPALYIQAFSNEFLRPRGNAAAPNPQPDQWPGFGPGVQAPPMGQPGFGQPGMAGQPGFQGQPVVPQNPAEKQQTFYVRLDYQEYRGTGTPTDGAKTLVADLTGYEADTLTVDEESRTIRFQHKGPIDPQSVFTVFPKHGFNSASYTSSTKPEGE